MSRGYVVERTDQGRGYLMPTGSACVWTFDLRKARIFTRRTDAERARCPENERVVPLDLLLQGRDDR